MQKQRLQDPPEAVRRLRGTILAVISAILLAPSIVVINVTQMASVLLLPFSVSLFNAYNRFMAGAWWGACVFYGRRFHGVRIEVTGDALPCRENAIVVANHQAMSDITFLMFLAEQSKRLPDLKWFVKQSVRYVPGIGWGMLFLGCIFVKRNWTHDKEYVERAFRRLNGHSTPYWIMLFAESTRFTETKLEASAKRTASRGLPPFHHVLPPRPRGFVASVKALRKGHMDAVYDVTIGYPDGVPTLWQYMRGFAPLAHIHVRRYATASLPESDADLTRFISERYQEKDRRLAAFYRDGRFPESVEASAGTANAEPVVSC